HLRREIELLESVQRSFTKLIPGLYDMSYADRLQVLGQDSLELRRIKLDLCKTYSIYHGLCCIPKDVFFADGDDRTRGNCCKLKLLTSTIDCRRHFFSFRIVEYWNALPDALVTLHSLHLFRCALDKHKFQPLLKSFCIVFR